MAHPHGMGQIMCEALAADPNKRYGSKPLFENAQRPFSVLNIEEEKLLARRRRASERFVGQSFKGGREEEKQ